MDLSDKVFKFDNTLVNFFLVKNSSKIIKICSLKKHVLKTARTERINKNQYLAHFVLKNTFFEVMYIWQSRIKTPIYT